MKNTNGISSPDNVFHASSEEQSQVKRFKSASYANPNLNSRNVTKSGFYRKNIGMLGYENIANGDMGKMPNQQEQFYLDFKKKCGDKPKDIRRFPNFYYMYKQKRGKCINDFNKKAKTDRL